MEKRKKERKGIDKKQGAYLEIPLPYPKDTVLKREIIDLSDDGAAFKIAKSEGFFLPGTPLKDLKLMSDGKKEEIAYAEVVYVSEITGEGEFYQIGLSFKRLRKDFAAYKRNTRVFRKEGVDKRKFPRFRISYPAAIESLDGREKLIAHTLNISQKGLVAESRHDLLIDLKVKIKLSILEKEITAKVLWSVPSDKDGHYHLAFAFDKPLEGTGQMGTDQEIFRDSKNLSEGLVEKAVRLGKVGQDWVKRTRSLYFRTISSPPLNRIIINGTELINFGSFSYLGLSNHPKVKEATINCIKKFGIGAGSVPGLSGTMVLHNELEERLAKLKGAEAACLFSSGFITNVYFLLTLLDQESIVICDEKAHASIMDGAVLSGAELRIFKHNDMQDLEKVLSCYPLSVKKLIVIDGVYSMDGDLADLPNIYKLAQKYNASIMIDEAHATGVIGKKGHGVVEHFGLEGKIDFIIGTLSKALGGIGGFVACKKEIKIFLKTAARATMFSTSLPPSLCAGIIAALDVIESEPELKLRLWQNIDLLKNGLIELGYNTGSTQSAIIPVIIGHEIKTYQIARLLHDEYNIFVGAITRPAVPRGTARLRLCVTAMHTKDDINNTLKAFKEVRGI